MPDQQIGEILSAKGDITTSDRTCQNKYSNNEKGCNHCNFFLVTSKKLGIFFFGGYYPTTLYEDSNSYYALAQTTNFDSIEL